MNVVSKSIDCYFIIRLEARDEVKILSTKALYTHGAVGYCLGRSSRLTERTNPITDRLPQKCLSSAEISASIRHTLRLLASQNSLSLFDFFFSKTGQNVKKSLFKLAPLTKTRSSNFFPPFRRNQIICERFLPFSSKIGTPPKTVAKQHQR